MYLIREFGFLLVLPSLSWGFSETGGLYSMKESNAISTKIKGTVGQGQCVFEVYRKDRNQAVLLEVKLAT